MAKLNVRGNEMMEQLVEGSGFPVSEGSGSLVICLSGEEMPGLQKLYDKGIANGVKGLKILSREEVLEMEPNITDNVYAALYAPTAGIVCPFSLNIALAENACTNGVEFRFNTEVQNIRKTEKGYELVRIREPSDQMCSQCGRRLCGQISQYGKRKEDPYHTQTRGLLSAG